MKRPFHAVKRLRGWQQPSQAVNSRLTCSMCAAGYGKAVHFVSADSVRLRFAEAAHFFPSPYLSSQNFMGTLTTVCCAVNSC